MHSHFAAGHAMSNRNLLAQKSFFTNQKVRALATAFRTNAFVAARSVDSYEILLFGECVQLAMQRPEEVKKEHLSQPLGGPSFSRVVVASR